MSDEPRTITLATPAGALPPTPNLNRLGIRDLRPSLPRAAWSIGSQPAKTSLTLHYNGPPVAAHGNPQGELRQLIEVDAPWHMHPGNLSEEGGDGIMYHFAVLSNGAIYQLRTLDAILWHCANADGNENSLAIHFALGGNQAPTAAQWQGFGKLCEALIADYHLVGRSVVFGHREWPRLDGRHQSICPGPVVFQQLVTWRAQSQLPRTLRYRVSADRAVVREGPGQSFPVALKGQAIVKRGHTFASDRLVQGDPVEGNRAWVHRADGLGFLHRSVVEVVPA